MRRSHGKELPGTVNSLIVGDLLYLQSKLWGVMVTKCIDGLFEDVHKATVSIIRHILDERSSTRLRAQIVIPSLDKIEMSLRKKTAELLNTQQSGHPITYNHYFTENGMYSIGHGHVLECAIRLKLANPKTKPRSG
jgi:hypothetical protein